MHTMIEFPNLGIYLADVGKSITVFNFDIAFYGITIGIGMLMGILIASWQAKRVGVNPEHIVDVAMYGIIFGIIGARIYYVVFSWDMYKDDPLSVFNLREGGLAIYGGVIAAIITVIIFGKIKKVSAPLLFDAAGPGLVLGQAIGRWGNFFNREAFGEYTDNLFAMQIPFSDVRLSEITVKMQEHLVETSGGTYIQVHPTFLYESLWNLAVLFVLLAVTVIVKKRLEGLILLLYMVLYGSGRFWIEGLRTDQLLIPGTELPVSQVLSGVLVVTAASVLIIKIYLYKRKTRISIVEKV